MGSGALARAMAGRLEEIAADRGVDRYLEEAIAVKRRIVGRDPREAGERKFLNFGHTLGHAIEASEGFAGWSHGEAVAAGMAAALRISAAREGFPEGDAAKIAAELVRFAGRREPSWTDGLERALVRDKKADAQGVTGVLLADWGEPVLRKVPPHEWRTALGDVYRKSAG